MGRPTVIPAIVLRLIIDGYINRAVAGHRRSFSSMQKWRLPNIHNKINMFYLEMVEKILYVLICLYEISPVLRSMSLKYPICSSSDPVIARGWRYRKKPRPKPCKYIIRPSSKYKEYKKQNRLFKRKLYRF